MELKQLRYFVHVAELGSFTRAAVFLSVAQPALSRQIRNLESELGAKVFYRNGRGVELTTAGHRLIHHAKAIIDRTQRARNELLTLNEEAIGSTVLGVPPTVGQFLTAPLVRIFRRRYPGVALRVVEVYSAHVHEWLSSARIDVGLAYDAPRANRNLVTEHLWDENLCLVGPGPGAGGGAGGAGRGGRGPDFPFLRLGEVPLMLPGRPHGLRLLVDTAAAQHDLELKVDLEVDSLTTTKELVQDGTGYTVLPLAAVHKEVESGRMTARRLTGPPLKRTVVLATAAQRSHSMAVEALVTAIRSVVKEFASHGKW
jgi:LysR family nitrogen assimilation transcriptional regulator